MERLFVVFVTLFCLATLVLYVDTRIIIKKKENLETVSINIASVA